jgi:hypothetical protein
MKRKLLAGILIFILTACVAFALPSTQKIIPRTAVTIAAAGQTFDTTVTVYGARATRYILECPDMTGNGTTTFSIVDANSVTVYAGAAHPENENYPIPIDVELVGTYTLRLYLSVAAGGAGATAYITILGE